MELMKFHEQLYFVKVTYEGGREVIVTGHHSHAVPKLYQIGPAKAVANQYKKKTSWKIDKVEILPIQIILMNPLELK